MPYLPMGGEEPNGRANNFTLDTLIVLAGSRILMLGFNERGRGLFDRCDAAQLRQDAIN
jgi:hypothetical protein